MFQDIKVSDDLNNEFLEYIKSELSSTTQNQTMTNLIGLDFNIYVLQVKQFFMNNIELFLSPRQTHGQLLNRLQTHLYFLNSLKNLFICSKHFMGKNTAGGNYVGCTIYQMVYKYNRIT
jgi:hypothetical protein